MLDGMMVERPLTVPLAIEYGAELHGDSTIVSVRVEGDIHRTICRETLPRSIRLVHDPKEPGGDLGPLREPRGGCRGHGRSDR